MSLHLVKYLSLTCFTISFPICVAFTVILFKYRKTDFSDPFYDFVRSLSVADLLILVWTQVAFKLPLLGVLTDFYKSGGSQLAKVLFTIDVFVRKAGDFILIDLIINRVTATVFRKRYQQIWTKQRTNMAVLIQWGLAVFLSIPSALIEYQWIDVSHGLGFTNHTLFVGPTSNHNVYSKYIKLMAFTNLGRVMMGACCYLLILWKWLAYKYGRRTTGMSERRRSIHMAASENTLKKDLEMTWAFLAISFLDLMRFIWQVVVSQIQCNSSIDGPHCNDVFAVITLFYISTLHEFYSWSKPYIFIVCCPKVREKFLYLVCRCRPGGSTELRSEPISPPPPVVPSPPTRPTTSSRTTLPPLAGSSKRRHPIPRNVTIISTSSA